MQTPLLVGVMACGLALSLVCSVVAQSAVPSMPGGTIDRRFCGNDRQDFRNSSHRPSRMAKQDWND